MSKENYIKFNVYGNAMLYVDQQTFKMNIIEKETLTFLFIYHYIKILWLLCLASLGLEGIGSS